MSSLLKGVVSLKAILNWHFMWNWILKQLLWKESLNMLIWTNLLYQQFGNFCIKTINYIRKIIHNLQVDFFSPMSCNNLSIINSKIFSYNSSYMWEHFFIHVKYLFFNFSLDTPLPTLHKTTSEMKIDELGLVGSSKMWIGKDYVNFIYKDFVDLHDPFEGRYSQTCPGGHLY